MEQQTVATDAQPAASSAAPVRAEALVQTMSDGERAAWQKTGALPDRVTITKDGVADSSPAETDPADSSSAMPTASAASTDASPAPASEPGKPPRKAKGADARKAELDAEIAGLQDRLKLRRALREELATLERPAPDARPAASSAAQPTTAEWERFAAMTDAPKEEDFQTVRDYTIAMSLFVADKRADERATQARHTDAVTRHTESVKKTIDDAKGRIEQFRAVDPDLDRKIDPQLVEILPASLIPQGQPIEAHHALMENVLRSDFTPQLLIHFSTPEGKAEWTRLCQLGSQSPDAFLRAFGRVEARYDTGHGSAATPTPKHVSSAPTPPTVLGTRTADTTDPVDAAIKAKDLPRYMSEANKRELAGLRG